MPAPQEVSKLVKRFDRNRESYRSSEYNETQARREFIDPFFKALGWDIDNEQGYAEAYKDVVHEDAIKIDQLIYELYGLTEEEIKIVDIWASNMSRDDRNRIARRCSWTYYVAELHNNHC